MMGGRFELAYRAGQVSRLTLWRLCRRFAWRETSDNVFGAGPYQAPPSARQIGEVWEVGGYGGKEPLLKPYGESVGPAADSCGALSSIMLCLNISNG